MKIYQLLKKYYTETNNQFERIFSTETEVRKKLTCLKKYTDIIIQLERITLIKLVHEKLIQLGEYLLK